MDFVNVALYRDVSGFPECSIEAVGGEEERV
jgi:hypothetical protein